MTRRKNANPQRNYIPPPLRRTRLTLLKSLIKLFTKLGVIAKMLKQQRLIRTLPRYCLVPPYDSSPATVNEPACDDPPVGN